MVFHYWSTHSSGYSYIVPSCPVGQDTHDILASVPVLPDGVTCPDILQRCQLCLIQRASKASKADSQGCSIEISCR